MSIHAARTAFAIGAWLVSPTASMVTTRLPATAETGVMHERVGSPSTCTVQAPHRAMPQPYLVPVRSKKSRTTQSSGVSGEALKSMALPLR